jgi:hypothetical protein
MSDTPAFYIKNLGGAPYVQRDSRGNRIYLAHGAFVPIFDEALREKYEANPGWYEVQDSPEELKPQEDPRALSTNGLLFESAEAEEEHPLGFVQVVDSEGGNLHNAKVSLQDGRVVPVLDVLEGLRQQERLKVKQRGKNKGEVVLWPGARDEQTFRGVEAVVEALTDNPGLLLPQE